MSVFEEIKSRLSLVEIVRQKIDLQLKGNYWTGLCPFHKEKTPSFTVSDVRKKYYCFGCHSCGDVFDFVMQIHNYDKPAALQYLAKLANVPLGNDDYKADSQRSQYYQLLSCAHQYFRTQLDSSKRAQNYLLLRDLAMQTWGKLQLGYAPADEASCIQYLQKQGFDNQQILNSGLVTTKSTAEKLTLLFRDRIMFPIFNGQGQVVGFGGRDVSNNSKVKYINSADNDYFKKGSLLYNLPLAKQASERLIVVEGYTDVASLVQNDVEKCVAVLGTAVRETHLELLWQLDDMPYVCFDGDEAGRRAMFLLLERALRILPANKTLAFVLLPPKADPDNMIRSLGISTFISHVDDAISFKQAIKLYIQHQAESAKFPVRGLYYQQQVRKVLSTIPDPVSRDYYIRVLTYMFSSEISSDRSTRPLLPTKTIASTDEGRREKNMLAFLLHHPELCAADEDYLLNLKFKTIFLNLVLQAVIEVWEHITAPAAEDNAGDQHKPQMIGETKEQNLLSYVLWFFSDKQDQSIAHKKAHDWLLVISGTQFRQTYPWTKWNYAEDQTDILNIWQSMKNK